MNGYQRVGECPLCGDDPGHEGITVRGYAICFICAWSTFEALNEAYSAPELTILDRLRHERENGKPGPRKPKQTRDAGYVYYLRVGGLVKIGYTKDIGRRMRGYPPHAQLAAAHPGTKEVEKSMHRQFASSLEEAREWFRPTPDIEQHIASVRDAFGDPASLLLPRRKPKTQEQKARDQMKPRHSLGKENLVVR